MKSAVKVFGALNIGILGLCLVLAGRHPLGGQPSPQNVPAPADRYLTHITTDKPIYRTGEKVYVRGVVLGAEGHAPGARGTANFEIKGPKGDTISSGLAEIVDSVAGFSWDIPAAQAGGEYTVRITHPTTGDAPAERKFDIRAYRAPRLKSQIVFVRDGYGPGDTVGANLHVDRAEGGIPSGAKVSVSARVDGAEVWKGETRIDAAGNASASFRLPASISRGEGTIAMVIEDGGTVETASKTIPILLQTVDIAFYPEGGDLVAGLTNRVYVEGRTPAHKPADMAGVILNRAGREVATFRTAHEGRGRFSFVPAKGESYSLRVNEPAGIKTVFPLPVVKDAGVVIASASDVTPRERDVVVRVAASRDGDYRIALSQRGKEFSSKVVSLSADRPAAVELTVPRTLDGVLVATVFDSHETPMAERLLFRQPQRQLHVKVVPDRSDYVPGDKVTLRVLTTDDKGKPVGGLVGLTVTDSSVLEMIEKREQAPRLPVMVLLENDVKDLSDAHVYLDDANPNAPLATDLLLGTQGWRRFGTLSVDKFVAQYNEAARRVLGNRMITAIERAQLAARVRDEVLVQAFQVAAPAGGRGGGRGAVAGGIAGGVLGGILMPMPVAAPPPPPPGVVAEKEAKREDAFAANGIEADGLFKKVAADRIVARQAILVREYAHTLRPGWTEGSRVDFTETVYWNAGVKTAASTGTATVSFNLSDSVTAFRVLADGVSQDGVLGSSISHVESVQPFSIEAKMPLQVTSGDVIQLPVSLINGMNRELPVTALGLNRPAGIQFEMPGDYAAGLRPNERARRLVQLTVGREFSGLSDLTLDAKAGRYGDSVTRKLDVQPLGFPHQGSMGGVLESNGSRTFEFTLPREIVKGSVSSSVTVYPTPLASMTDALQSLLREPYGCFEQTSSTSYPMIMAQQYFLTHTGVDPAIIEKTRTLLESSYKKLTAYESKSRGYEWFGADPGHEALTAYGLMQFTDMAQVRSVDKDMLVRTRAWLLARRDGNGGFNRNAKAIDSFGGAPTETTNAYITWALLESGEKGLEKEVAAVKAAANSSKDSYVIALAANALHLAGDRAGARQLMDKLVKAQDVNGSVNDAVTTITRSGGSALAIETTALSALAWMREPAYAENVQKSVRWIVESNKNGRFASTQSTVLALRTIVAYDAAHARPKAPGRILLTVDGKAFGQPIPFSVDTQGSIVLPEFASELGPGKHAVMIKMEGGSSMPFSMSVKHHSTLPDSSDQAQVGISVSLRDAKVQEGAVTEAVVSIANKSHEAIPTPVAIVGLPGGLEVRHDQLKELVKSGKIDAYEVIGREVVLYWRGLKADARFDIPLSVVAAVPGTYTGPASRAYLYYSDEYKTWAPGLNVSISPR